MLNRLTKLREERAAGENGFTLIELLVVVVIIGILIAIAIPLYLNYTKGANDKASQSDLRNAINILEQCNTDNGSYPVVADFPTGGGNMGASCTGQKVNVSSGSTFTTYTPVASPATYTLVSHNSKGNSKWYCYNSANGGAVQTFAVATAAC
jgi:type IV pilus assembly protein PilA